MGKNPTLPAIRLPFTRRRVWRFVVCVGLYPRSEVHSLPSLYPLKVPTSITISVHHLVFQSFIRINWGNILPGMQGQFDKISASFQDLLGETYDYRSVMHYDSTAFSKNGQNTIETIQPGFTSTIGAAVDLSDADVKKAQLSQVLTRIIFSVFSDQ